MVVAIVAASVLVALALIAFAIWAHQYTKVGPNEVLIISGRKGYRILRGGGTYVRRFRERVQRLSLELMQFDVRSAETYSMHGVPVQVDGVCMVKIDACLAIIEHAAQSFLSGGRGEVVRSAMQAVEGHLRPSVGSPPIEAILPRDLKLVNLTR